MNGFLDKNLVVGGEREKEEERGGEGRGESAFEGSTPVEI